MEISNSYDYIQVEGISRAWCDMPNPFAITLNPTERALELLGNCMDGRPWKLISQEIEHDRLHLVYIPAEESEVSSSERVEFYIDPSDTSIEEILQELSAIPGCDTLVHEESSSSCLCELQYNGEPRALIKLIKEGSHLAAISYFCDENKPLDIAKWQKILNTFSFAL